MGGPAPSNAAAVWASAGPPGPDRGVNSISWVRKCVRGVRGHRERKEGVARAGPRSPRPQVGPGWGWGPGPEPGPEEDVVLCLKDTGNRLDRPV